MKFAVKLLLPTLAALALAGCGADLAPKPTALWQSMPSPDPEPMVESWWRLADKGDGLVRVETVESLPESNKADLTSVHHDKRYENARSVLVTLAFACDAQRGVAESRVLTSDRMAEGDVLSKASIETGREALPFGGDYIPFADGRVDPAWVQAHKVPAHAVAGLELLYAQAPALTGPSLQSEIPNPAPSSYTRDAKAHFCAELSLVSGEFDPDQAF